MSTTNLTNVNVTGQLFYQGVELIPSEIGGGGYEVLLDEYTTTNQITTGTDTPTQLNFGAGATSSGGEVTLDGNGTLTINDEGRYLIIVNTQTSKNDAQQVESTIFWQPFLNGSPDLTRPSFAQLCLRSQESHHFEYSIVKDYNATDEFEFWWVIDSVYSQDDDGGVATFPPTNLVWETAPSARIRVIRAA